jgi:hypothetical protein
MLVELLFSYFHTSWPNYKAVLLALFVSLLLKVSSVWARSARMGLPGNSETKG